MYSSRMKRDVGLFVILFLAGVATANILFVCLSIAVLLYIALALLCGEGDFDKTMEIAIRCGQDTDCNPSTAAGVLGFPGNQAHGGDRI